MSDPWDIAAENIRHRQERQADSDRSNESAQRQQEADLNAAIKQAEGLLESFMANRGVAAMRLLTAASSTIVFGEAPYIYGANPSRPSFVYLNANGFGRAERQHPMGGTGWNHRPSNVSEATHYFAHYGPGNRNPHEVLRIVNWLTAQLDALVR